MLRRDVIPKKTTTPATKPAAKNAPPVRVPKRATPEDRIPRVIANPSLDDHLAVITHAVMQAGLSWAMIDAKWDAYRAAFDDFDVRKVANYDEGEIDRIMNAPGVIRSRAKIEGTIHNARTVLALEREFGAIRAYQTSFPDYAAIRKDTKERFAYLGDLSTYYWLFRTGGPVPNFDDWLKGQERDHPRMREMVSFARVEVT